MGYTRNGEEDDHVADSFFMGAPSGTVVIDGRELEFYGPPCKEIQPEDLTEEEIQALEKSHGWEIKRPT